MRASLGQCVRPCSLALCGRCRLWEGTQQRRWDQNSLQEAPGCDCGHGRWHAHGLLIEHSEACYSGVILGHGNNSLFSLPIKGFKVLPKIVGNPSTAII